MSVISLAPSQKKRVLFAMSGGIDSSVGAIMLHKAGYEVIGVTMKTWAYGRASKSRTKQIGCCNLDTIEDARQVAATYGFPYTVLDLQEEFGQQVIDDFETMYWAGKTPNPCVRCNTYMKWEALLLRADRLGCDYIATGHYAQVKQSGGRYHLYKGVDPKKDQSYALWGLPQASLKRTLFPLGELTKDAIRSYALAHGFERLVKKSESYEICFIPDNDYRGFLKRRNPQKFEKLKKGTFVLENGEVVGTHDGYPFFTVGQRRGLGVALGYPVYVTEIIPEKNQVILGTFNELARKGMRVHQLNMIKYPTLTKPIDALIKVRYNSAGTEGTLTLDKDGVLLVHFKRPEYAVAPGQAAVFYAGNEVIGGGWILSAF